MIYKKKIIVPVDFFDHVYSKQKSRGELYTSDDIRSMMSAMIEEGNADVCLWQVTACGNVTYRSNVENRLEWEARAPARAMKAVLDAYDPLRESVRHAKNFGLPLFGLMSLFDEGFPPMLSRLFQKHPHCQWADRTGSIYLRGVPCYDYEEAVAFRLELIKEVLSYGVDGLCLSLRSHCDQSTPYRQRDFFGFNTPVVNAFKERYGVNLRDFSDCEHTHDQNHFISEWKFIGGEFDTNAWHRLKGESLTLLLKEIRKLVGPDFPVWICFLGPFERMMLPPHLKDAAYLTEGLHSFARFHIDWENWLEKKLVDAIVVQCYRGMPPEDGVLPFVSETRARGGQIYWLERALTSSLSWRDTKSFAEKIRHLPIDGVLPYEAECFDVGCR